MKRIHDVIVFTPDTPPTFHRFNTLESYLFFIEGLTDKAKDAGLTFEHGILLRTGAKEVVTLGSKIDRGTVKQARSILRTARGAR